MKRREFVRKSGLVAGGLTLGSSLVWGAPDVFGSNKTLNIGVIGTGDRGSGIIPLLNQIEHVCVTACCDILPFRLENGLSKTDNKAKAYRDYKALLENKDVDAVIVSTPFFTHDEIAIDALDAGKHVYCEKTMAKGLDGINKLVNKVNNNSQVFQVGHQYHSSRLYSHVVDLIKNGEIGKVIAFQCQWNRNGNWRRPIPDPKLEKLINWRMYREYSGGLTAELCSHQIDFVHWVLGENPSNIRGVGGIDYWKDGRETYDNIHLTFEYRSGVKATFRCLTANALGDYQIMVHGDKGSILLDYTKAWIFYEKNANKQLGEVDGVSGATMNYQYQGYGIPIEVSHEDPTKQALIDFRDSILDDKPVISNIETGKNTAIAVQLSLDAMYEDKIVECHEFSD